MSKQPTAIMKRTKVTFVSGRVRVTPISVQEFEGVILAAAKAGVPFVSVPGMLTGQQTLQFPHIETIEEALSTDINYDPDR